GEIYNYIELRAELTEKYGAQFNTDGDGEVIVVAFHYMGAAAVSRLRGMFAFMIWDSYDKVVFGARDPFGIKPLYYAVGRGGLATERYFTPRFRPRAMHGPADATKLHADIADALRDSVAKHMRADVTVGSFLSGGIDSTAIAALAKEHNPDLIAFTTGFER